MGINFDTEKNNDYLVAEAAKKAAKKRVEHNNINSYDDLNRLAKSSVSIFPTGIQLTENQKNKAYTQYSQTLLDEYYDINKDGKVTTEEFGKVEEAGSLKACKIQLEVIGFQLSEQDRAIAQRSGNLFAKNLDMNADGIISSSELAFFNQNADACDGNTDGKILNMGESAMFEAVTGMNANDPEINRVVNKYLLGESLTEEEKVTLEKSTTIIRESMRKAANL